MKGAKSDDWQFGSPARLKRAGRDVTRNAES